MSQKSFLRAVLLPLLVLCGCASTSTTNPTDNEFFSNPSVGTPPDITPIPEPSNVILQPTPTIKQVASEATPSLVSACQGDGVPIQPQSGYGFRGVIAFEDVERQGYFTVGGIPLIYSRLYLPGLESSEYPIILFGFSPDGEWLAYAPISMVSVNTISVEYEKWMIGLLSYQGERVEHDLDMEVLKTIIPKYMYLSGWESNVWINNELLLSKASYRSRDMPPLTSVSLISVLDPFEGIWREDLIAKLPDLIRDYEVAFSPDMTRALYIRGSSGLTLVDLTDSTEKWVDANFSAPHGIHIEWSPDSSVAAYSRWGKTNELFLIHRNGEENFSVTRQLFQVDDFQVGGFRWSTNSRYLAFSLIQAGDINRSTLHIYDLKTNELIFICPLYKGETPGYGQSELYWSPDSRYISYSYYPYPPAMVVIDLETGMVVELTRKGEIVGWSDKFPVIRPSEE